MEFILKSAFVKKNSEMRRKKFEACFDYNC